MKRRRLLAVLAALAALALTVGLAACGGDDDDDGEPAGQEASFELNIGTVLPQTGDLSSFGPPLRKAANLAVEEINSAIQEVGADHTVNISHEDDQTDAQAGVSAARTLVNGGASCIVGAAASSVSIPVSESVTTQQEVLQISPASTSDEITALDDNGFMNRTAPPDAFQGPALADAIEADLGEAEGRTVNIGARNDAYGTGLADTFAEAWEGKGGQIGERVIYEPRQPSYDSEARQIVSGDPDAWVIIDFPETYGRVGPALVRTGEWDASRSWITDGLQSGTLPDDVGQEATEGLRGTAPGAPDEGEASAAFDTLFSEAPGPERQTFDAQSFDATILCYLAAVAAGSAEGADMAQQVRGITRSPGNTYTWQQLPDAIRALQEGEEINYDGASGPIDMDDNGDATAGVYDLFRYQDGELDVFDEVPLPDQTGEGNGTETNGTETNGAAE